MIAIVAMVHHQLSQIEFMIFHYPFSTKVALAASSC